MLNVLKANPWKAFLVVAGVLSGMAGHLEMFPWLPLWAQHAIELGSFVTSLIAGVLINPSAITAPTVSDATRAKLPVVGIIAILGITATACAGHVKIQDPFRNADGSINVNAILVAAGDGLAADCAIPGAVEQTICAIGMPALQTAQAAAAQNKAGAASAAAQSLQATLSALPPAQQSQLAVYFQFAVNLLKGFSAS